MGEAARRKAVGNRTFTGRSWAIGRINVVANDVPCSAGGNPPGHGRCHGELRNDRSGERLAAGELCQARRRLPDAPRDAGCRRCRSAAQQSRPALGPVNVDAYRMAILWLALRETVPHTGYTLVNMVVKAVTVLFSGDRQGILEDTWREMAGKPFSGNEFQMLVAITDHDLRLDPDRAVAMHERDLLTMAGIRYRRTIPTT